MDVEELLRRTLPEAAANAPPATDLHEVVVRRADARARTRRVGLRVLAAAAVVALVAVAVVASGSDDEPIQVASAGRPVHTNIERTRGLEVIVAQSEHVWSVDLGRREATPREVAGLPDGRVLGPVAQVGDSLVVVKAVSEPSANAGRAYVVDAALDKPARLLGPTGFAFPSATPGRVWLRQWVGVGEGLREVTLTGATTAGPFPFESGQLAMAAVGDTILVETKGALDLFDPKSGAFVRHIGSTARPVATRGTTVAWADGFTRPDVRPSLHLVDTATGVVRTIAPPAGTAGFVAGGAFSPDGRWLAAFTMSASDDKAGLTMVDTKTLAARVVPGSHFIVGETVGYASWAPTSSWVFFGQSQAPIGAYSPAKRAADSVDLPFTCDCYQQFLAVQR